MMGIEPEPPGWKALHALTAGGTKGRDDGLDPAVFRGGLDPPHAMDRVRRDPVRRDPEGIFDGVEARLEPAAHACLPRGVVPIPDRIKMTRDRRIHADIRPDQTDVDGNGLRRNRSGQRALSPRQA